jgi:hypothetical protein
MKHVGQLDRPDCFTEMAAGSSVGADDPKAFEE